MELRQLEYLVAVIDEGGFTRAAEKVHVSQSGVSAQIRQLERSIGHQLLDRSRRTVEPTAAGVAVLPFARAALAAVASAQQAADDVVGLLRGRVDVGMVTGCALPALFAALGDFRQQHPGVEVSLVESGSTDLVDALRLGRLDLVVAGTHGPPAADLERALVVDEPLVAVVPPDHEWSGRRSIPLAALREEPLVCLPIGAGVRAALDATCRAAGWRPAVAMEASAPVVVADLAARGLGVGVGVLSASMVEGRPDLRVIPLAGPGSEQPRSRLEVLWRPADGASPAAQRLAGVVRAHLQGSR